MIEHLHTQQQISLAIMADDGEELGKDAVPEEMEEKKDGEEEVTDISDRYVCWLL